MNLSTSVLDSDLFDKNYLVIIWDKFQYEIALSINKLELILFRIYFGALWLQKNF